MGKNEEVDKIDEENFLVTFIRTILTSLLVLGLWIITNNPIITIASMILGSGLLYLIIGKYRSTKGRIVATILLIMFILISIMFFRVQKQPDINEYQGTSEIVTPGEIEPEENAIEEEQKEDETLEVEEQKVSKKKNNTVRRSTSTNTPNLTATYGGIGGNPYTITPERASRIEGNEISEIVCPDNSSQDKQLEEERRKGYKVTEHEDGVSSSVDKTPIPEKQKDESTRLDIDKEKQENEEKQIISSTEEPKIPEPLPDDEQIKQDAQEVNDDELEDLASKTEPETPAETTLNEKTETEEKNDEVVISIDKVEPNADTDSKKDEVVNPPNDSDSEAPKPSEVVNNPVSITVDNTEVRAGEPVRFSIMGDVQSIDGLDGLNFNRGDGYVIVNTEPNVATVITISVTGVDGSSAVTSVVVNV